MFLDFGFPKDSIFVRIGDQISAFSHSSEFLSLPVSSFQERRNGGLASRRETEPRKAGQVGSINPGSFFLLSLSSSLSFSH